MKFMGHATFKLNAATLWGFGLSVILAQAQGTITYTLHRETNPTADQLDAYSHITVAMDSALKLYNTHTSLNKQLNVYYNTAVTTADANFNGTIRFGSARSYMAVGTSMHEMAHTLGIGTTAEYRNLVVNGVFTGIKATAMLRIISGDPGATLHGDSQHFWPHGINYASEVDSEQDLIDHCRLVEAMVQDMFQEDLFFAGRVRSLTTGECLVRKGSDLTMGSCADSGAQVRIVALGEINPVYRMHFGDRVLDTPNESTAPGVVMGLYSWNGGAHQRFLLEVQNGGSTGTYRIRMVHSNLYLRTTANQVLQDHATTEPDSQLWEFISSQDTPLASTWHSHNSHLWQMQAEIPSFRYNLLGRRQY